MPITNQDAVDAAAKAIAEKGVFAFDLEFVSADRYIPDLCLVQICWPGAEPAAVDPMAVDIEPLLKLIADSKILTVAHAAKQDLQLLTSRHGCRANNLVDSQIAAAFCGIGDQVGLARLAEEICRVGLDKGSQFTDWSQRPLTEAQLRYALDDVRYLLVIWEQLEGRLEKLGRLSWVREECDQLASSCATISPPEEAYRRVSGAGSLQGKSLGALRALAAWRETTARTENKPPSWLIPDKAMVEASRKGAKSPGDLRRLRGVGTPTVKRYGDEMIAALAAGHKQRPPASAPRAKPTGEEQLQASVLNAVVQAECRRIGLAPRFVGARAEVEALVYWYAAGAEPSGESALSLLSSWRRELIGERALAWLRGEHGILADSEFGLRWVAESAP